MKTFMTLVTISILFLGCNSTQKNEIEKFQKNKITSQKETTNKEFMKEGFINNNTFRVIILSPFNNCEYSKDKILKKGEKRALVTLSKFLISKNRVVNSNTRIKLTNLIKSHGHLEKISDNCEKDVIFSFNVKANNLKSLIKNIAPLR